MGYYFLGYDDFGTPWIISPWVSNLITAIFGFVTPEYALCLYISVGGGTQLFLPNWRIGCSMHSRLAESSYKVSSKE